MPCNRRESMGVSESTRIGTVFAGYRVDALLGRGGMSVVYKAEHIRLGRKVALKVLAAPLAHDESYRERFVRESQRAADLDHPNVIPIYDAGEIEGGDSDGLLYIAMRYVEGSDLRTILRRDGPLGVGKTIFVLDQVAVGAGRRPRQGPDPPRRQAVQHPRGRAVRARLPHRLRGGQADAPRPISLGRACSSGRSTTPRPSRSKA